MRLATMVGLLGSVLALGCAGIGDFFKEPDIRLDRVIVRGAGLTGGTLDLIVELDNPNQFDLRGTGLEVGFDVEGLHVGDARLSDEFEVTKGNVTTLSLPLRFEWAGVGKALRTALGTGEIPYTMKGQATLQTPFGRHSVPFRKEGRAPLTRPGGNAPLPSGP